jgi:hypothetical protein
MASVHHGGGGIRINKRSPGGEGEENNEENNDGVITRDPNPGFTRPRGSHKTGTDKTEDMEFMKTPDIEIGIPPYMVENKVVATAFGTAFSVFCVLFSVANFRDVSLAIATTAASCFDQRKVSKIEMEYNTSMFNNERRLNTKMHLVQIRADMEQNEDQLVNDLSIAAKETQRNDFTFFHFFLFPALNPS